MAAKILAGVLEPDTGRIGVEGRVGSLLSVQAGVMAMLTGRENTLLLGVLAGMTPEWARAQTDAVKEASGLGKHYEHLVASYSQGMRARLGFATAAQREIDLLLLDEVHEALDHATLETLCDRAIRLADGAIVADGAFGDLVDAYAPRASNFNCALRRGCELPRRLATDTPNPPPTQPPLTFAGQATNARSKAAVAAAASTTTRNGARRHTNTAATPTAGSRASIA